MAPQSVRMRCTDHGNLWRTSQGSTINAWLDPVQGGKWVISVDDPNVTFRLIPFDKVSGGAGMKPHPDDLDFWRQVADGCTRDDPKDYDVQAEFFPDPSP